MIISHRWRFVYIGPPKTASTALHHWLSQPAFCERCGADLEVTHLNPLEVEWSDLVVDTDPEEDLEPEFEYVSA